MLSENKKRMPVFPAAFERDILAGYLSGAVQIYQLIQQAPAPDNFTRRCANNRGEIEENM
ncbi:hypothetical protein GK011_16850 [Erwinia sp. J316]|uniref:Uncharacterized protein n=1 Tax=Erwinia sorbitola TaxID=2681984 RepID=A0ABW9RGY3_9GAMM|nr:hypothetical protein [Erwinia sorbitola]